MHHFHTALPYQKTMLRQTELCLRIITKNRGLWITILCFGNFVSVLEFLIKSWFNVPTIQMYIFILFVNAEVFSNVAFFLWVSLRNFDSVIWHSLLIENRADHSISSFVTKLKHFKPIACPCKVYKIMFMELVQIYRFMIVSWFLFCIT